MDVNKTLATIRECVGELRSQDDDGTLDSDSQTGALLEAIESLDEWLSRGGFLPDAWKENGRR